MANDKATAEIWESLDPRIRRTLRMALRRGTVTAGLAGCQALSETRQEGLIKKDRRYSIPRYRLTPLGRAVAEHGYSLEKQ